MDGTDSNNVDSGIVEDANLDNSSVSNGSQGSITVNETAQQIADLQKKIDQLSRALQSDKDKAVAKTNKRVDALEKDLREALRSAAQKGQSAQDLLGEIEANEERETREALAELARTYRSGGLSGNSGGTEPTGVDVTKVLRELELDEADTRVQVLRSKSFSSEAEAYREAAKLLKQISSKQPAEADKPSVVSNARGNADEQTRLRQEYDSRAKTLRGQALINLKMEMRKKGLRIS